MAGEMVGAGMVSRRSKKELVPNTDWGTGAGKGAEAANGGAAEIVGVGGTTGAGSVSSGRQQSRTEGIGPMPTVTSCVNQIAQRTVSAICFAWSNDDKIARVVRRC
jgi:hypothetical protein